VSSVCREVIKSSLRSCFKKIPPKTHNLIYLSNSIGLEIPENHLETLEALNDLSIVTRYPEDMDALIKSFKKKRAEEYLRRTKALLRWLKKSEILKK
jgi:HEPN domain-containing protein